MNARTVLANSATFVASILDSGVKTGTIMAPGSRSKNKAREGPAHVCADSVLREYPGPFTVGRQDRYGGGRSGWTGLRRANDDVTAEAWGAGSNVPGHVAIGSMGGSRSAGAGWYRSESLRDRTPLGRVSVVKRKLVTRSTRTPTASESGSARHRERLTTASVRGFRFYGQLCVLLVLRRPISRGGCPH